MINKSWLIVGPGRTGSLTIVNSILSQYILHGYKANMLTYVGPDNISRPINPLEIVHVHNTDWLEQVNSNTEVIISTRDLVESALSWCILPKLGDFHFHAKNKEAMIKFDLLETKIKTNQSKFYLHPDVFLSNYYRVVDFYKKLKIKNSYILIDYSDWEHQPSNILQKLNFKFLYIPKKFLTMKNPGKSSDWITNWEEITEICNFLPRNFREYIL